MSLFMPFEDQKSDPIIHLETDRLLLRDLMPEDEKGLFLLDSDAEVHRYLGGNPINSLKQAQEVIEFIRRQYQENGIGRWAVIEKHSGHFVGWSGFKFVRETTNGCVNFYDLGYRLVRNAWGKGYATEAAKALVNLGFTKLALTTIYAMADGRNKNSIRVLQKAGFLHQGRFEYEGIPHEWFKISKP